MPATSAPIASLADGAAVASPDAVARLTDVAVIGGGPAGLMAAEVLAASLGQSLATPGLRVDLFDGMPSVGRKFLLAGKGGLNLTHAEPVELFKLRYSDGREHVASWLDHFGPQAVRDWAAGLGIDTFVGSSGKVFPTEMKAAPLLRAWVHRLRAAGVHLHMRHRWRAGLSTGAAGLHTLTFDTPTGSHVWQARAVVLALGGGSWSRLGSDGRWQAPLAADGVPITPLQPANCGFDVAWSEPFVSRHAGAR